MADFLVIFVMAWLFGFIMEFVYPTIQHPNYFDYLPIPNVFGISALLYSTNEKIHSISSSMTNQTEQGVIF